MSEEAERHETKRDKYSTITRIFSRKGITTTRSVILQKSADLIYFAAEA
jgi:hypothetical protein